MFIKPDRVWSSRMFIRRVDVEADLRFDRQENAS